MKKQELEELKNELNDLKIAIELTKIGVGLLLDIVIDSRRSCIKDLEGHPGFIPPSQISDLIDDINKICALQGKLFNVEEDKEEGDCQSGCTEHKTCREKTEDKELKDEKK